MGRPREEGEAPREYARPEGEEAGEVRLGCARPEGEEAAAAPRKLATGRGRGRWRRCPRQFPTRRRRRRRGWCAR